MSSLATLRANIRKDLHDEDATAFRWTDGVLDRHIERALSEYSQVSPVEVKSTLTTVPDSRDVQLDNLVEPIRVVAAEYPIGEYPPSYVPFSVWGKTLTLDLAAAPSGVPFVNVWWHKAHNTLGNGSFPEAHDDIIVGGAAAFAALEWASFASNRLNVGGDDVWGRYMDFGNVRLRAFQQALRDLPEANRLRSGRFYVPQTARFRSQSTDPGPV